MTPVTRERIRKAADYLMVVTEDVEQDRCSQKILVCEAEQMGGVYVPALLDALDAAETALTASYGRETRLREAMGEMLIRQAFQGHRISWTFPVRVLCPECEYGWLQGQPEEHAAECKLVIWRKLATGKD